MGAVGTRVALALGKLVALVAIVLFVGSRVVPWVLLKVTRLRSRELFTLTVMVFSVAIAWGAYALFGVSMALGAFLAGMVVAQSPVSHQAAADALPLRDAFAVLFFVAVGMLFDPTFLLREPLMVLAAMGIILLVKPLIALLIVAALGHSVRTALTVALGLAQIGEFSFILSDVARKHGVMRDVGHNVLVAGAILSIMLNPLLFRLLDSIERWLKRRPRLWALLNARGERRLRQENAAVGDLISRHDIETRRLAVVVGYGPVGRTVNRLLRDAGVETVVIDLNSDTVLELGRQEQPAIYGDASREAILEQAGARRASHLVVTLPQSTHRAPIVAVARSLNPDLKIFVRARYLREREELEQAGTSAAIYEEAEAAVALARLVLIDAGAGRERIDRAVRDIRLRLILENVSNLRSKTVRSIMIPWTRARRLWRDASLAEVRRQLGQQPFSRWPVIDRNTGRPTGYLLAKDLILLDAPDADWTRLIRPLITAHPNDDIESAMLQFQRDGATICVVMDGDSPLGIVTIEDILEQVIGRMEDEYPRHEPLLLKDVIRTNDNLLRLACRNADDAILAMAATIPAAQLPPNVDVGQLAIARERVLSTYIGAGIAIPHAQVSGLERPIVVFARSEKGVEFSGPTPGLANMLFLLVTPTEEPDLQVLLLSEVARIAGQADTQLRLHQATSPPEIAEIPTVENLKAHVSPI
jgi:mannitol/fructose-specific phosphotransferase system IIA component (Ntr-type)/voltage-gated potassium channel Kch